MSDNKGHHFVPQILTRQWARADGRVQAWRRKKEGAIWSIWQHPKEVMEENHLYRLDHVPSGEAQKIEHKFSELETKAGEVLKVMTQRGGGGLTEQQMIDWSVFVLAQRARVPNRIAQVKHHVREGIEELLGRDDPEFNRAKGDLPYRNLKEFAADRTPSVLANAHLRVLMSVIGNVDNLERMLSMVWSVCDLTGGHSVILGDDPVTLIGSLHQEDCIIALPIAPRSVFFAASNHDIMQRVQRYDVRKIAPNINHNQASQAQRVVVGDVEPGFLDKRMPR